MKPHLFTLLLRSAIIEERIADVKKRKHPNSLELLRLKALRMVIKERIERYRANFRSTNTRRRMAA